jgi:aminoglycoside phosphotransferase (APT) family kinase protein
VDADTARVLAEQAVRRLDDLHSWTPSGAAEQALRESPVHAGFVGRAGLVADIEYILATDRGDVPPRHLIDGLMAIAERAPEYARADVPVHADGDWLNWLVHDRSVTALLDFERARFGEPADDWVLLAVTSGPHLDIVLDVIADMTESSVEALRAACELREAAFQAEGIRYALEHQTNGLTWTGGLAHLERLVVGRRWWHGNR